MTSVKDTRDNMKKLSFLLLLCICLIMSLCSCAIKSNRKISEKVLSDQKLSCRISSPERNHDKTVDGLLDLL